MSEQDIRRYTADELMAMVRRGDTETDDAAVAAMTDEELERLIADDPDEGVYPDSTSEGSWLVSIRVDRDVLAWFQAQGPGAADRMAAALRTHVDAQRAARDA